MNTQLLVFDLDGTLIDTMGDYADKAAALIFEYYGTPRAEARRRYFDTSGLPFEKQLELMFPRLPCNTKVAEMFESWKDGYLLNVSLSSETEKLLRGWRNGGVRIAISSNNLEPYVQRLTRYWPVDIALGYRSKDRFGKGEPHFQKLEERFGFPRQRTLFIGDSPNDARISAQSKVPFWALLTDNFAEAEFSQYQPDAKFITQLSDLNRAISEKCARTVSASDPSVTKNRLMPASMRVQTTRSASVNPSTLVKGLGCFVYGCRRDPNPAARINAASGAALVKSVFFNVQNFHDFIAQFPARCRDQTDAVGQVLRRRQRRSINTGNPATRFDHQMCGSEVTFHRQTAAHVHMGIARPLCDQGDGARRAAVTPHAPGGGQQAGKARRRRMMVEFDRDHGFANVAHLRGFKPSVPAPGAGALDRDQRRVMLERPDQRRFDLIGMEGDVDGQHGAGH